ncbi:MAG: ABC transporter ATP-binding protein [Gemmatimonadales bacterium]
MIGESRVPGAENRAPSPEYRAPRAESRAPSTEPLLEVRDLSVHFPPAHQGMPESTPVAGVDFSLTRGELLALVGESGSGKTLTGLALLGLVPPPGRIGAGSSIRLEGQELVGLKGEALRAVRGRRIAMVFQDPLTSLTPVLRIGTQLREALTAHRRMSRSGARRRGEALLAEVGMPDPVAGYEAYPHELSGGLRQRALIAIALAGEPDLLIADEPTSALDVTIQAQILETLDGLRQSRGMAVLLITHDLGIVAGRADRVAVMYAGLIVEQRPTADLFQRPEHPYTRALLKAIPRLDTRAPELVAIPGAVPPPDQWWTGCRFQPRCPEAITRCASEDPPVVPLAPGSGAGVTEGPFSRCWLPAERKP